MTEHTAHNDLHARALAGDMTVYQIHAETYDKDYEEWGWMAPTNTAKCCAKILKSRENNPELLRVLDVGCGTGLSGEAFAKEVPKEINYELTA